MSLITDALGLRQVRAGNKLARKGHLPPLRPANPQRTVIGVLCVVLFLAGLASWRGVEAYEWLERVLMGLPDEVGTVPGAVPGAAEKPLQKPAEKPVEKPAEKAEPLAAAKTAAEPALSAGLPAPEKKEKTGETGGQAASAGLMGTEDMASINVSLAPTKEEEEKVRKAKEEERMREVREYLRRAVIQGVSQDGQDSRVLMDGQLVGLGEKTPLLDLVLEKVETGQILFRDSDGKRYPKSY